MRYEISYHFRIATTKISGEQYHFFDQNATQIQALTSENNAPKTPCFQARFRLSRLFVEKGAFSCDTNLSSGSLGKHAVRSGTPYGGKQPPFWLLRRNALHRGSVPLGYTLPFDETVTFYWFPESPGTKFVPHKTSTFLSFTGELSSEHS